MILLGRPAPMKKIVVAYPLELRESILSKLQELGVIDVEPLEAGKLIDEYELVKRLRDEIINLLSKAELHNIRAELYGVEAAELTIDRVKTDVNDLVTKISVIEAQINELRRQLEDLEMLKNIAARLPINLDVSAMMYEGKRISSVLFVCKKETLERLLTQPYVVAHEIYELSEDQRAVLVLIEGGGFKEYLGLLKSCGAWYPSSKFIESEEFKTTASLLNWAQSKTSRLKEKLEELEGMLREIILTYANTLGKYVLFLDNQLVKYETISRVLKYKHLEALVGWVPAEYSNKVITALQESGLPVYVELQDPSPNDNPPTLMRNKPILKFYQVITRLYGVPGYREWDPTPLIAYSFALFFALMISDVAYALLGILATLLLLDKFVENPNSVQYREFKGVLLVSNVIALIIGALSGSVFGDLLRLFGITLPAMLPSLTQPLEFIKLSLIIGLIHVNLAHILATIRSIRDRNLGNLLNELGLLIGQIFGIPYVLLIFMNYRVPLLSSLSPNALLIGSLVGVVMIIAGTVISMRALGMLMWIFQITGLLGDVLSYVRLAGVGLATLYMATSFNYMVDMIGGLFAGNHLLKVIVSLPVIFITQLLVFILAQLGAFVHSLRLCILEFLTKFYDGVGREYNPLRVIRSEVITIK
ncbi:MAG: V-type ATPase 116kDa subunit family protein [Candidatus Nezhaarchaeales archaeon]